MIKEPSLVSRLWACGTFAPDVLSQIDQGIQAKSISFSESHCFRIDGKYENCRRTLARLKDDGFIEGAEGEYRVTVVGTEALRAWNNGEAGL